MFTILSKKILTVTAILMMVGFYFSAPFIVTSAGAVASPIPDSSYTFQDSSGIQNTADVAGYTTGAESTPINTIISTIILTILSFVGVLFMGFAMYGAFTWMTSMGNSQQVEKANKIIMGALFGLIITLAAYVISYFAISYFKK
jgi:hypothetical protein